MPKLYIKILPQIKVMVFKETIYQFSQHNINTIVELLKKWVANELFFILYDSINFYAKVKKQRIYNQNHQVNYIASYICFMKSNKYFHNSSLDYSSVNSFELKDFLPNNSPLKYHCKSVRYILSQILKQYFSK